MSLSSSGNKSQLSFDELSPKYQQKRVWRFSAKKFYKVKEFYEAKNFYKAKQILTKKSVSFGLKPTKVLIKVSPI